MKYRWTRRLLSALVCSVFVCVALSCVAAEPAADKTAAIDLKLPKPMFVGTPKNIQSDNLEKATGVKRPPFMAPEGTTNLAAQKAVTSSDMQPVVGELTQITDGDKEGADGSYVELGPGKQWLQIDLGKDSLVYAIVFWHYHQQARVYRDTVVQIADDPDFITNVRTLFNNDHDNSSGLGVGKDFEYIDNYEGKLIDAKGEKARYVRLYSNGSTASEMNHYIELEVYGKPAK